MSEDITYPLHRQSVLYGHEHKLRTLDICLPRPLTEVSKENALWVVYDGVDS
jgi:hypothetical protein